jgi:hypothetical protein
MDPTGTWYIMIQCTHTGDHTHESFRFYDAFPYIFDFDLKYHFDFNFESSPWAL